MNNLFYYNSEQAVKEHINEMIKLQNIYVV